MKYILIIILIFVSNIRIESYNNDLYMKEVYSNQLIAAIAFVESKLNPSAHLKREDAVGILQIRPVMVKDINRILKLDNDTIRYSMDDRWDIMKSIEMFHIYTNYYTKSSSKERITRRWNGGPTGHNKRSTLAYWNKVKRIMESDWIQMGYMEDTSEL